MLKRYCREKEKREKEMEKELGKEKEKEGGDMQNDKGIVEKEKVGRVALPREKGNRARMFNAEGGDNAKIIYGGIAIRSLRVLGADGYIRKARRGFTEGKIELDTRGDTVRKP